MLYIHIKLNYNHSLLAISKICIYHANKGTEETGYFLHASVFLVKKRRNVNEVGTL